MALNCEMCGHRTNEVKTGGKEKGVPYMVLLSYHNRWSVRERCKIYSSHNQHS